MDYHHHNFLFDIQRNSEECCSILPCHATGIEDRTAPGTLLPCHIHNILGVAFVDNGKNHFIIICLHCQSSLSVITQKPVHIHTDHAGQRYSKADSLAIFNGFKLILQAVHNTVNHILPDNGKQNCLVHIQPQQVYNL